MAGISSRYKKRGAKPSAGGFRGISSKRNVWKRVTAFLIEKYG
jgi:hypothetical protein